MSNTDSPVMKRLKKNLREAQEKKAALMEAADNSQTDSEWDRLMDELGAAQIDVEEALSAVRVNRLLGSRVEEGLPVMKSRKLKKLIANMDAVMSEFSEYGAEDSEPDYELQRAMKRAWNLGEVVLPRDWQLFSYTMDCTEAERRLNEAALPILEFLAEAGTLGRDLREYCWRV